MDSPFQFRAIGEISSPFKEKFSIPRQPGLAPEAKAVIVLRNDPKLALALRGIEGFSHIWVIFVFHASGKDWNPLVRPPRLGGAKKMGALATRSPHRPNPIGLSVVKLERVETKGKCAKLFVSGVDFLDRTPVLDIKPYIPYADSLKGAQAAWADARPRKLRVRFSRAALASVAEAFHDASDRLAFRNFLKQVLEQDPRPAFQKGARKLTGDESYAAKIDHFDVRWRIEETFAGPICTVIELVELTDRN